MRLQILVLLAPLLLLASCDNHREEKKPAKSSKAPSKEKHDPSSDIEAFTGAHTRLVWSEYSAAGASDTFATTDGLLLKGLDTRDGLGERALQSTPGNYSRPLLSCDGSCILWTDKNTVRKGGKKHYKAVIYLTSWKGGKPIRLAEGYAVDCWRDPATGVEFVYAVQNLKATKGLSLEGERLVRFPLNEPSKIEVVYDDTPITPDNVQISRDGTRASGLFPWPHAGILCLRNGKWTPKKLTVACWTSLAPDNSGVSWAFDGAHKSLTMFADDGTKAWPVKFDTVPGAKGREFYHPRWSNHPRHIVLTGPYTKQKGDDGSVINKGGDTAQVFLGRLSETADKVEAWLQISHDKHSESYPDAWIADADSANLKGFTIPHGSSADAPSLADTWPVRREGLLFLWQDRSTLNAFTTRDGGKRETHVESVGAARHGRLHEMLLDGGSFDAETDSAAHVLQHLRSNPEASFEALVLPPAFLGMGAPAAQAHLVSGPNLSIRIEQNVLVAGNARATESLPVQPFHLVLNRRADGWEAFVNGTPLELAREGSVPPASGTEALTFGGGWTGGLMHVALYDHVLTTEDAAANAEMAQARTATFPAPPPRVKLLAKLAEASAMPTQEGIAPYTGSLVACVYDVQKVLDGELQTKQVLVKHWAMLGGKTTRGFPREVGKTYELIIERESDHAHLKGERVMDDTTAFDLEAWFDVSTPRVVADAK